MLSMYLVFKIGNSHRRIQDNVFELSQQSYRILNYERKEARKQGRKEERKERREGDSLE